MGLLLLLLEEIKPCFAPFLWSYNLTVLSILKFDISQLSRSTYFAWHCDCVMLRSDVSDKTVLLFDEVCPECCSYDR